MENETMEQEANISVEEITSRESMYALTPGTSNEGQALGEIMDDHTVEPGAVKPAYALLWAMKILDGDSGVRKEDIARVLGSKFDDEQDVNFSRKVEVALKGGLEFGLLQRRGSKYCLSGDYTSKAATVGSEGSVGRKVEKEKMLRYYKKESTGDMRSTNSGSPRSRSPVNSLSSESSSEETEGVQVIEWALAKLNDNRGSTLQSIKRIVSSRYRKLRNFDRLMYEAIEEAMVANKVVKNGKRYRLISSEHHNQYEN